MPIHMTISSSMLEIELMKMPDGVDPNDMAEAERLMCPVQQLQFKNQLKDMKAHKTPIDDESFGPKM